MSVFANDKDFEIYAKLSLNWKQYLKAIALKEASRLQETISLVDEMAASELSSSTVKFTSCGFVDLFALQKAINTGDETILVSRETYNDTLISVNEVCSVIHNDIESCQTMINGLDALSESSNENFSDFCNLFDAKMHATMETISTTGYYYSGKIKSLILNADLSLSDKLTWFKEYLHIGDEIDQPSSFSELFDYEDQTYGSSAAAFFYSFDWAENPIGAIRDFWLRGVTWAFNMFKSLASGVIGLTGSFSNWFRRTFISGQKISLNNRGEVWGNDTGSFKFTFALDDDMGEEGEILSSISNVTYKLLETGLAVRFYVPGGELYVTHVEVDDTGDYTRYRYTCNFRPIYNRPFLLQPWSREYTYNRNSRIANEHVQSTLVINRIDGYISQIDKTSTDWFSKQPESDVDFNVVDNQLDFIQQMKISTFLFAKFCAAMKKQPNNWSECNFIGLYNDEMYTQWFKGNWYGLASVMTDTTPADSAFDADLGSQYYTDIMPNLVIKLMNFVNDHQETDYEITYEWCSRVTAGLIHASTASELANSFLQGLSTTGKVIAATGLLIAGAIAFNKVNNAYRRSTLALDQKAFEPSVLTDAGYNEYKAMLKKNTILGIVKNGVVTAFTKTANLVGTGISKIGQMASSAVQNKLPTHNSKIAGANDVINASADIVGDSEVTLSTVYKRIAG